MIAAMKSMKSLKGLTTLSFSWQRNRLLSELSDDHLEVLEPFIKRKTVDAGTTIIREGEDGDEVYLLCDGEVEVYREEAEGRDGDKGLVFATLTGGDYFGVMALMDETSRAASVRTTEPSHLAIFSLRALRDDHDENTDELYYRMLASHAREQNRRLRTTSVTATDALKRELLQTRALLRLGMMLAMTILVTWGYVIVAHQLVAIPQLRMFTSLGISVVLGGCALYIIRSGPYPASFYGLTLEGWRPALIDGLKWTVGAIIALTALKWLFVQILPSWSGMPIIEIRLLEKPHPFLSLAIVAVVYILVSALQELVARGTLQSSLDVLFTGRRIGLRALVLSNALFSMFHVHYSVTVALTTFGLGIFLGLLWIRRRSLVAVTVAHFLIGMWSIEFLNVLPLLGMAK